jgi:hypothetical protein
MSQRKFSSIIRAMIILVLLAPPPAQAREIGWRDLGQVGQAELRGLLGKVQNALCRLFELSRGGMDPNGES